ncbi:MAG TPA: c-type cytochrome [Candidatus Acidoferrales bacterium]|nr:c-type cytochrome [Candidatus Acidoferrales bacterium]
MSRTSLCLCAFLLAAFALQVCGQEEIPAGGRGGGRGGRGGTREFLGLGRAPDAQAAARGEKLYAPNCAFCHGEKARGAAGPNLVRSEIVLHDEKGELIGPTLSKGRVDKGMPAFGALTETQLADIGEFLHLQVELVANRGLYKRLNVVTGDPKAGEAYFHGAGGCAQCHSISGDLAHIGGRYQPEQLQTRFIWPGGGGFGGGGRGAARPQKVTVTLPSGQSIAGTVKQIDDFDISIYDASGVYHSWPTGSVKIVLEDRLAGHRQLLNKYTDADMHNLTAYLVSVK